MIVTVCKFLSISVTSGAGERTRTADHLLKVWFNRESARLSYKFRENLSPLEIYDILKDNYNKGVAWALDETKKGLANENGYELSEKDQILIEQRLLSDALSEAAVMSINIGNYRSFWLGYENPNNLVPVLRPLISANNTINANPGTNSLVITDYAENLQRLGKIIAALDQPAGTGVEVCEGIEVARDLGHGFRYLSDDGFGRRR